MSLPKNEIVSFIYYHIAKLFKNVKSQTWVHLPAGILLFRSAARLQSAHSSPWRRSTAAPCPPARSPPSKWREPGGAHISCRGRCWFPTCWYPQRPTAPLSSLWPSQLGQTSCCWFLHQGLQLWVKSNDRKRMKHRICGLLFINQFKLVDIVWNATASVGRFKRLLLCKTGMG